MLFENTVCVPTHETAFHYPKPQRATKDDIKPSPRVDGYLIATCCTENQADYRYLRKTSFRYSDSNTLYIKIGP